MKIASYLSVASLLAVSAMFAPACAADPVSEEKAEATDEATAAFSLKDTSIVGSLAYGETSPATAYTKTPRYRAYKFAGNEGDEVDVWVRSKNGDPVAWLLDNDWRVIAKNDDAGDGSTDSHVKATLPANASATHYIVVRDYWRDPMTFTVELKGGPKDFVSGCNVDADCAKVQKGCCDYQGWTAVRADKAAAYQASLGCAQPTICPKIAVRPDYSVAECNNGTHKCELVQPKDIKCGGFIMNSHSCPDGYRCQLPIGVADVPGKCVQQCGGIAARPCNDPNEECVDDPTDSCDPKNGGADCGGICQPKAPVPTDCRSTGCGAGRYCTFCWGSFACIPNGAMC
jgi:hypothetical protein